MTICTVLAVDDDADVLRYLRFFTFLEHDAIGELAAQHEQHPERRAAHRALAILNIRVTRQAVVLAYDHLFQLAAMLFVVSLPLALMLKGKRGARGATPATIPPAPPRPKPRRRPEPVPLPAPAEVEELAGAGSR